MLTVRDAQIDAFATHQRDAFEARVRAFLQKSFPQPVAAKGEDLCRREIHDTVERAFSYDIKTEIDVVRYVTVAFVLNPEFDTDPAFPWARPILGEKQSPAWLRVERIYRHAMIYLREERTPE